MLGYAAGGGAWLVQRGLQIFLNRKAVAADDARVTGGIAMGSMIGRGWLVALTIFAAGLADEDAGLSAAVLVIVLFTAYFTVSMITRPFETDASGQPSCRAACSSRSCRSRRCWPPPPARSPRSTRP